VSHNHHHANVSELNRPGIGSFPIMTTAAWRVASAWQRFHYRLSRHPLTILFSYVTIFLATMTIEPLVRNPRRNWDSLVALAIHGGAVAGLWALGGPAAALLVVILPYAIAAVLGSYLFYVQHNFPGARVPVEGEGPGSRGSLESSSYLRVGRAMRWLIGNINYHHVHHLNSAIPFYRLPEAMAAIPELQHPVVTTLRPRDIWACLSSNLWDDDMARMVSYRAAAVVAATPVIAPPPRARITGDVGPIGVG
jgi:omega-6 fatty acid desaturase (delta-12 desaturase)